MPKLKPDMMAASSRAGGGKRILAALEHGAKPTPAPARAASWTIDSWTLALGLLLLLMISVAWMMHDKTITPSSFRHGAGVGSRLGAAPRPEKPVEPVAEQAATIVNATSAEAMSVGAIRDQAYITGRPVATSRNGSVPALALPQTPAPVGIVARAPQTAARTVAATARPAPTAGTGATTASARDTDVTLLTALVAHANKPAVAVTEHSRDVVERKEGDTTFQLLARCKQLGLIEGMLCRSRICSDRWDVDAACRAPAH